MEHIERILRESVFFHAQVIKQQQPLYIELKKVYRQSEEKFISVLNNIRNNSATEDDLHLLHEKYNPGFTPQSDENFITLTTHNAKADEINSTRLRNLPGKEFVFRGNISNEFNENALPVERELKLKAGAQIMFVKNDSGEERRYYNGKIGIIKCISIPPDKDEEIIEVEFPEEKISLELKKEKWENVRYVFNKEKNSVDENVLGTYTQYPIRLAWAVTIHKSQGLTFQKAIIDAGESFAAGQVYVALSRLTGMEGMVLFSRITPQAITTDERVNAFANGELNQRDLKRKLYEEQKLFAGESLKRFFDWKKTGDIIKEFGKEIPGRSIAGKEIAQAWQQALENKFMENEKVVTKFSDQLDRILSGNAAPDYSYLHERTQAAANYFLKATDDIISSIKDHAEEMKTKKRVKIYLNSLSDLAYAFERKKIQLKQAVSYAEALKSGGGENFNLPNVENSSVPLHHFREGKSPKPKKGDSGRMSLRLFREGKTIDEIAQLRLLARSTIEGHLAAYITTGEIDVHEILSPEKVILILKAMEQTEGGQSATVKNKLGENFSYADIRAVQNHKRFVANRNTI